MKQIILKYVRQRGDDVIPPIQIIEDKGEIATFVADLIKNVKRSYKSKLTVGVKMKNLRKLKKGEKYEHEEFFGAPDYGKYVEFDQKLLKKAVKHGNAEKGIKYWIDGTITALIEELSKFNPEDLLHGEEKPKPFEQQVMEAQQSVQDKKQRRRCD